MGQRPCGFEGCDRPYRRNGFCATHALQAKKWGAENLKPIGASKTGPPKGRPLTNTPTYWGAHHRLRTLRGSARSHSCVGCGNPAREWAYKRTSDAPLYGQDRRSGITMEYSANVEDYQPMCRSCHVRLDHRTGE